MRTASFIARKICERQIDAVKTILTTFLKTPDLTGGVEGSIATDFKLD